MAQTVDLRRRKLLAGAVVGGIVVGGVFAAFIYVFLHSREGRGWSDTHGARVVSLAYASRELDQEVIELGVIPRGARPGRPLLVLLQGRSSEPADLLSDETFAALARLGHRAPLLFLPDLAGSDSRLVDEAIPEAVKRLRADPDRIAIAAFGDVDLGSVPTNRFCEVAGQATPSREDWEALDARVAQSLRPYAAALAAC
jgi:hypothetical protein